MSLDELREEIEEIDRDIVELIARRTYVADAVAEVKAQEDLATSRRRSTPRSTTPPDTLGWPNPGFASPPPGRRPATG